jgi:hypothetical protein
MEDDIRPIPINPNSITFNDLSGKKCYWVENYTFDVETQVGTNQEVITYNIHKEDPKLCQEIRFIEFKTDLNYYSINENNNLIKLNYDNIERNTIYYQFGEDTKIQIDGLFYEPGTYHYLNEAGNYIFAKEEHLIEKYKDKYYKITDAENLENVVFYEPDKYYYKKAEDDYEIDTKETMTHNQYYDISELYVISDENNVFAKGSIWNINVEEPPEGVILGTRTEEWEWKELDGFARNLNTIHGLIIEINNLIKFDDSLTRDTRTVQGCINKINDIINKIDSLIPNHFIAINEYGQMTSMEPKGDSWISVTVNKGNDDSVIITHTGPVASSESKKDDLTPKFGDTFTIEDWYFDSKGHKSNKTEHTVMIPKGSLTDDDKSGSDIITQLSFDEPTGALSTTRENLSSIKLAGYTKNESSEDVAAGDTLGQALSKL